MFRVSNFAKMAASAKNAMSSREAATPRQNLETITAAIKKLTATVDAYKGGLLAASSVSSEQAKLEQDIKNAIADGSKSDPVGAEEANSIIAYIRDTLEPSIQACMTALKNKKDEFQKAGLQSTVSGDMTDLRKLTSQYGEVLLSTAPEGERQAGVEVNKKIDANFEEAIKVFV